MNYLSCADAAKAMGITVRRIQQMCKSGEIPGVFKEGRSCLVSKYTFCKDFTKLYAFLVKAVYVPQESLEHNFVLEVSKKCTKRFRCYLITNDDA